MTVFITESHHFYNIRSKVAEKLKRPTASNIKIDFNQGTEASNYGWVDLLLNEFALVHSISQNIWEEQASVSEGCGQFEAGGGDAGDHGAVLQFPEAGHTEAEECQGWVQEAEG